MGSKGENGETWWEREEEKRWQCGSMVERVIHNHSVVSSNLTIATWLLGEWGLSNRTERKRRDLVSGEARKWKQNKFGRTAQERTEVDRRVDRRNRRNRRNRGNRWNRRNERKKKEINASTME